MNLSKKAALTSAALAALLLSGFCRVPKVTPPMPWVVKVTAESDLEGIPLRREYTASPKMEAVLGYLRALQVTPPPPDAGGPPDGSCRIELTLSDGSKRVYFQRSNRYLRKDDGPWRTVDPAPAPDLPALLSRFPSDG